MSIAARVIGDLRIAAVLVLAARNMAAERCRAAVLDRRHHLELAEADMAGIGLAPMLVRGRGRYPRPPTLDGARRGPLCRRLVFPALPGLLARLRQPVERALDASNHAGGDARIARCRIQLVVTQKRLDDSNIGTALEQVRREAVAQ